MTTKDLIAVIEIGSSAVIGAVGYRRPDGMLEVTACASEPSGEFIKNGVVRNIDKTAQCLTNIVNRLEGQLRTVSIEQVYVGLCGYTVHSVKGKVERGFTEGTHITADIVDDMADENLMSVSADRVVVKSIPQEYYGDGILLPDPVGCNCCHLSGHYLNLEARYSTMENLRTAFENAKVLTADEYITPLLIGDACVSATDRSLGCALVDIGASTTTVLVYKGGHLRFLAVIPLGDRLIVSDLVTLGMAAEEAEEIRLNYGLSIKTDDDSTYVTRSAGKVALREIGFAIRARFFEIIANVEYQICQAGFTDEHLKSGFIFTGGAMMMPDAEAYIRRQAFFEKMRLTRLPSDISWEAEEKPIPSKQMSLAALLAAGTEPCCVQEEQPEIDYHQGSFTTGILFDDEGNSAQEERDRQEKEKREQNRLRREREREERERERQAKKAKKRSLFDRLTVYLKNELLDE